MQTVLQLNAPESAGMEVSVDFAAAVLPAPQAKNPECSSAAPRSKILRFAESERILHWAIAAPFLVSFATGVILAVIYNPDPSRSWRHVFAELHRASGVALAVLPMLALLSARRDIRIHLYNIKQAWTWVYDDFKWLALMGLAAISSKFILPEQGKFNAAEKLNFMVLMSTYPLYVVTGFLMWLMPLAVLSWIMHCLMAMMATPLILGHLYMALINADTRPGLEGMISGHVDRGWAKHHYRRWYRKHHEPEEHLPDRHLPVDPVLATAAGSDSLCLVSCDSSANGRLPIALTSDTNRAGLLSYSLLCFPKNRIAAEHAYEAAALASAITTIAGGEQIGYGPTFDWIRPHSVLDIRNAGHSGAESNGHRLIQMKQRIVRAEIGNEEFGCCLLNELGPGFFLRLGGKLKKAEGVPALLYKSNHAIPYEKSGYPDWRASVASNRIVLNTDTFNQVSLINVGNCVKISSLHPAILPVTIC